MDRFISPEYWNQQLAVLIGAVILIVLILITHCLVKWLGQKRYISYLLHRGNCPMYCLNWLEKLRFGIIGLVLGIIGLGWLVGTIVATVLFFRHYGRPLTPHEEGLIAVYGFGCGLGIPVLYCLGCFYFKLPYYFLNLATKYWTGRSLDDYMYHSSDPPRTYL